MNTETSLLSNLVAIHMTIREIRPAPLSVPWQNMVLLLQIDIALGVPDRLHIDYTECSDDKIEIEGLSWTKNGTQRATVACLCFNCRCQTSNMHASNFETR